MIVDDHHMVREGLKVLLSTTADLEVVGEAEDGAEAVRLYQDLLPDVVLMDIVMPGMDGAEATARLREVDPNASVIALTSFVDEDHVKSTLNAGAIGYVLKDARSERLVLAIRDAFVGRGSIDSHAMQAFTAPDRDPHDTDWGLTPREREVLALISAGLSNKEIGQHLHLSTGTVRLHVSNILAKLGVTNRTSAAMIAMRDHLT